MGMNTEAVRAREEGKCNVELEFYTCVRTTESSRLQPAASNTGFWNRLKLENPFFYFSFNYFGQASCFSVWWLPSLSFPLPLIFFLHLVSLAVWVGLRPLFFVRFNPIQFAFSRRCRGRRRDAHSLEHRVLCIRQPISVWHLFASSADARESALGISILALPPRRNVSREGEYLRHDAVTHYLNHA